MYNTKIIQTYLRETLILINQKENQMTMIHGGALGKFFVNPLSLVLQNWNSCNT